MPSTSDTDMSNMGYWYGNEFTDITGGWISYNRNSSSTLPQVWGFRTNNQFIRNSRTLKTIIVRDAAAVHDTALACISSNSAPTIETFATADGYMWFYNTNNTGAGVNTTLEKNGDNLHIFGQRYTYNDEKKGGKLYAMWLE